MSYWATGIGGVKKTLQINQSCKVFLILPPSYETWILRLNERSTISDEEAKRRLKTSLKIFDSVEEVDPIIVINHNYIEAAKIIDNFLSDKNSKINQNEGRNLLNELRAKLANYYFILQKNQ